MAATKTTVQRWGNSLAVRIPRHLAEEARLERGGSVEMSVRKGALVVEPTFVRTYSLSFLVKAVTRTNLHREVDFGPAVGGEVW